MADSILVRFDDDVGQLVREEARAAGVSLNRFINDALLEYSKSRRAQGPEEEARQRQAHDKMEHYAVRLADARDALGAHDLWQLLDALVDLAELTPMPIKVADPLTWRQFKYSKLNQSGSDEIAQQMYAEAWDEINRRDWKWYRADSPTDAVAKYAWFNQRRRLGLPAPPPRRDSSTMRGDQVDDQDKTSTS